MSSRTDWSSGENTRLQIPNGSLLSPKLNLRSLSSSTDSTRQADVSPSPHVSILSAIASPRAKLDVSTARRSSFDVALSPVQDSASSDGIKLANIMQQDYERRLADANAYTQRIQNECDEAKREVARMKDRLANMGQLLERERHTVRGQQIQLQATQHNPHRTPPPLHVPHTPLSPTTLRSPMSARGALSSPTSARSFRPDEFQDRISALGIATTPSRDAMLSAWLNPQQTHSSTAPVAPAASIAELRDAMESLMFELDVDKLWFQVGQCARALGRCQRVALYLVDETKRELVTQHVPGSLQNGEVRLPLGTKIPHGLVGTCALLGEQMNIPNVTIEPRFVRQVDSLPRMETHNMLLIPIRAPHHHHARQAVYADTNTPSRPASSTHIASARASPLPAAASFSTVATPHVAMNLNIDTSDSEQTSSAPPVESIYSNYLTRELYHSLPDVHSRTLVPNILPFANYANAQTGRSSLPDYIAATARAPEMAAFAGAGGAKILDILNAEYQRTLNKDQEDGDTEPTEASRQPQRSAIRAQAVLLLINRQGGVGGSSAFSQGDQAIMATFASFVSQLVWSAQMQDAYHREREKTRSLLLGCDALLRGPDIRTLLCNIAQAIRRSCRLDFCVLFALDQESMDLLVIAVDCAPGVVLRIPNSYTKEEATLTHALIGDHDVEQPVESNTVSADETKRPVPRSTSSVSIVSSSMHDEEEEDEEELAQDENADSETPVMNRRATSIRNNRQVSIFQGPDAENMSEVEKIIAAAAARRVKRNTSFSRQPSVISRAERAAQAQVEQQRQAFNATAAALDVPREVAARQQLGHRLTAFFGDAFRGEQLEQPLRVAMSSHSLASECIWVNRPFHIHDTLLDKRFASNLDEYIADRQAAFAAATGINTAVPTSTARESTKRPQKDTVEVANEADINLNNGRQQTRMMLALPIPDLANPEPLRRSLPIGSLVCARMSTVDLQPWEHLQLMDLQQLASIAIRKYTMSERRAEVMHHSMYRIASNLTHMDQVDALLGHGSTSGGGVLGVLSPHLAAAQAAAQITGAERQRVLDILKGFESGLSV